MKVETQSHDLHPSEKNRICGYLKIISFNILFVQKVDYKWPNLSQTLDTIKMPVYQHAPCILKKKSNSLPTYLDKPNFSSQQKYKLHFIKII